VSQLSTTVIPLSSHSFGFGDFGNGLIARHYAPNSQERRRFDSGKSLLRYFPVLAAGKSLGVAFGLVDDLFFQWEATD
jgi:hypothetical protein